LSPSTPAGVVKERRRLEMVEEKRDDGAEPVRPASAEEWALWDAAVTACMTVGGLSAWAARQADALIIERRRRAVATEAKPGRIELGQTRRAAAVGKADGRVVAFNHSAGMEQSWQVECPAGLGSREWYSTAEVMRLWPEVVS
jgi:hypothetical protein